MAGKLPTAPYKGVRDFYPEDQFLQRYLAEAMSRACESFGYEEVNASILESAELYRAKGTANDEIINEQSYTFTDRGDREVILRPEMTPSVARMVAARRRELAYPQRWYSVQNFFRYERPQRGRLREFWQLNADLFGETGVAGDAEIIALAHRVMLELGATENDFEIRISDRRILEDAYDQLKLSAEERRETTALLDRRAKLDDFDAQLESLVGASAASTLLTHLDSVSSNAYLEELRQLLEAQGVRTAMVDTTITRGFDYYTGLVFEVFDTSPENKRALFGGGRYDHLLESFGAEPLPAVGFGMGDVTARDFLETHELLPKYAPATELMLCVLEESALAHTLQLAQALRSADVTVAVNYSLKRAGEQVKVADKLGIPFVICVGAKEVETGAYTLKHLGSGNEDIVPAEKIADHLFSSAG